MTLTRYRRDPVAADKTLHRWLNLTPSWWDLRHIYEDTADLMRLLDIMSKESAASPILAVDDLERRIRALQARTGIMSERKRFNAPMGA